MIGYFRVWWIGSFCLLLGCGGAAAGKSPQAESAGANRDIHAVQTVGSPVEPRREMDDSEAMEEDTSTVGDRMYLGQVDKAPAPEPPPPPPATPVTQPKPAETGPAGEVAQITGPLLIFTAHFVMAVFEVDKSLDAVERTARDLGGFLSRRDDHSITVRVPAARFEEAVATVEEVGDVVSRNVSSEDVTDQFRDLTIRLQNATAMRDRLEKLLAKADKVEDALNVERELGRVTEEIELIKGRLKFLKDRVSFSTLTVEFRARGSEHQGPQPVQLPLPWLYDLGLNRLMNL
jgi:hypothetical protein